MTEAALEEIDRENGKDEEEQKADRRDVQDVGDGCKHGIHDDAQPREPLHHAQRTECAQGAQGP
eukprot:CAMPEP_0205934856 /NCGR_PEP_ID=MMETSP1325-20131115/37643_1 /ASSEMBLY_ACC=CAM_ASM_000708 /TAXON_ID=236786 /ORGANISM="Florenciella sp., Strain RCC1007" /LENGTH=63 /DNA_ID=CAMNT_0053304893 /DNA_START=174 /DNA_END=362 /DNA_ORIENTATION=-